MFRRYAEEFNGGGAVTGGSSKAAKRKLDTMPKRNRKNFRAT